VMTLTRPHLALCLAIARHLAMSPGPCHRTCHIAVPLAGARAISLCSSCQLTLLVHFSFFIFIFSANFIFCGPITAVLTIQ
jgi:hypothetical protein